MVALLVFVRAALVIVFGRKKLLNAKGLFGGNVFKNPARCTRVKLLRSRTHVKISGNPPLYFPLKTLL